MVGRYSRHKRAKSCSKTLDPSLKVAALAAGHASLNANELTKAGDEDPGTDSTLEAASVTVPRAGRTSSNLIQLEDVWDGVAGRGRGQWVTTNTSSSSSEYLRNNLSTARTASYKPNVKANKMRDFFRFDGTAGGVEDSAYGKVKDGEELEDDDDDDDDDDEDEEILELEDDDDARMLLFDSLPPFTVGPANGTTVGPAATRTTTLQGAFVEHYGKNNATSSSLSSSDYASVYSATSSGGNGPPNTPGPGKPASSHHGTQFKLLATPEEGASGGAECVPRVDYSPQQHRQSSPKQQRAHQLSRMNVMPCNNATNPFLLMTLSAGDGVPAGTSSHRIYNNFLDGSPTRALTVPGSPADKPLEKNHRLRAKPQTGTSFATGRLPSTGSVSPRGTDRYDYRAQPKPSNGRAAHFRQMAPPALDTDLTYQEDYLEHYQNAARARSTLQSAHEDFRRQDYRHGRSVLPAGGNGGEDPQNNALANENSDANDTDEELRQYAGDGDIGDDVATTDELLLLVNAAIDIRRSQTVEQPGTLLGNARKKNTARKEQLQRGPTLTDTTNRRLPNEPLSGSESVANE
uniref:Uncharacterized protein n=1 Tax=Anopheles maculatus TaxID=74869 RepID=A0A182SSD2_9DIPT